MDMKEIREKKGEEINRLEEKLREEKAALRMQTRLGQSPNSGKLRLLKRDLARVLTAKRERQAS